MLEEEGYQRPNNWVDNPKSIVEVGEMGDYNVQIFLDNYAGARLDQCMGLFDRAFALLTERGHYSRTNAFGEMHCDSYLWIEKCEHSKVLIYETQSRRVMFIKELQYEKTYGDEVPMFGHFHIREIYFKHAYPAWKRTQLKGATLKFWREADFKPRYGDSRDIGYLGTAVHSILRDYETSIKGADMRMVSIMDSMWFWEVYLNDPEELE